MLERIKTNWQILTVLLLLWSFFDLYNYYSGFKIDIQNYISTSELPLLVLPSILKGALIFFLLVLFVSIGNGNYNTNSYDQNFSRIWPFKKYVIHTIEDFKSKKYFWAFFFIIVLLVEIGFFLFSSFIVCGTLYLLYIRDLLLPHFSYLNKWIFLFLFTFFSMPFVIKFDEFAEKSKNELLRIITFDRSLIFYYTLLFFVNSIISNRIDFLLTTKGKGKHQVSFFIKDKKLSTSDSIVYIGATQSYIFLRNIADSNNLIFKTSEVDNYNIK